MRTIEKIAFEEHFMDPAQDAYFRELTTAQGHLRMPGNKEILLKLQDVDSGRIADMDRVGIKTAILSYCNIGGVQCDTDTQRAVSKSQQMNDFLAGRISAHPDRFMGWAALPMQDVEASVSELRRCVTELGFKGAMINGQTHGQYLDEPKFLPIWETAAELNVPIYLHPGVEPVQPVETFGTYPILAGPGWGWSVETGFHALRIICGGVFDRFPSLTLILGHMGELLPFHMDRFDQISRLINLESPKLPISHYICNNIMITTSGNVSPTTLLGATMAMGVDRILFATDYPLMEIEVFANAVENGPLCAADLDKIYFGNAQKLLDMV